MRGRLLALKLVPPWIGQTAALLGIYLAILYTVAVWMPAWKNLDWDFFDWVQSRHAPRASADVLLIDVASWNPKDIPANRRTVARFIQQLVAERRNVKTPMQSPKAVVLDIEFGECQTTPCSDANWNSATRDLEAALDAGAKAKIKIYAPIGVRPDVGGEPGALVVDAYDQNIYRFLAGKGHTHATKKSGSKSAFYLACYAVPEAKGLRGQSQAIWALPLIVTEKAHEQACAPTPMPLPMGATLAPNFSITGASKPETEAFEDRYLVVGTVKYDRDAKVGRAGPEIVDWWISDALKTPYTVAPPNGMLLVMVPVFSALTALAFTAWFFVLRRLRLARSRRFLPWFAAALALLLSVAAFGGFEIWLYWEKQIQPQVSLVSLGMGVCALLCGIRGRQIEFQRLQSLEPEAVEKYDYDVFISYAHDEGPWVYEHVYLPLKSATLPNGQKLEIFFDTEDIHVGADWQSKISLAIDESKFIVPVYSTAYFQKPYCLYEIGRAHRKWINEGRLSYCVMPIARGRPEIEQSVNDIEYESIDERPDVVQRILAKIVARLSSGNADR